MSERRVAVRVRLRLRVGDTIRVAGDVRDGGRIR